MLGTVNYANLGEPERDVWQARLIQVDGLEPTEIPKFHGDLIAFGWVEQNTGQTPCCYHITLAGQRALRQIQGLEQIEESESIPEKPAPKFPRKKKKEKSETLVVASAE